MRVAETDVAILGAGPAGLAAAVTLAQHRFPGDVAVLDLGNHFRKRPCPVDAQSVCRGCGGICNVISGFGGAIHYGDGVKLSKFPSGRRLEAILGPRADEHMGAALDVILGRTPASFQLPAGRFDEITLKPYPVMSLTACQVSATIERLHHQVTSSRGVTLRLGAEACSIQPLSRGFDIRVIDRSNRTSECVRAKHVIVAVGRKGLRWWRSELRRLGVAHAVPTPSVGVRFECPAEFVSAASQVHPDFKATIYHRNVKIKTFCFCAGQGGGRIKFTDYGRYTLLDGHVVEEAGPAPANFALLAQLRDESGTPRSIDWIDEHLIEPYRAMRADRPGKPVMQWYPDFRARTLTCRSTKDFEECAGFHPSLSDYAMGNIAALLSADIHRSMSEVFDRLLDTFVKRAGLSLSAEECRARVGVIALELEGLWDEITIDESMESSVSGLYVCGDCSGHAQGILQAAASGVAAGVAIDSRARAQEGRVQ